MADIKLIIALAALALSVWNFRRLDLQDLMNSYKDKRYLHKDCLDEAKTLLEKIESELTELQSRKSTMLIRGSTYLGTKGADSGMSNILEVMREIDEIKNEVATIYFSLDKIYKLSDKDAFDECMEASFKLKTLYIKSIEKLNIAKLKTDQVIAVEKAHSENKSAHHTP